VPAVPKQLFGRFLGRCGKAAANRLTLLASPRGAKHSSKIKCIDWLAECKDPTAGLRVTAKVANPKYPAPAVQRSPGRPWPRLS
jgi:hypothetical protein